MESVSFVFFQNFIKKKLPIIKKYMTKKFKLYNLFFLCVVFFERLRNQIVEIFSSLLFENLAAMLTSYP